MKRLIKTLKGLLLPVTWRNALFVSSVLLLTNCTWHEVQKRFPNRSHPMNEFTDQLRPVCVGRYIWEIPRQAKLGTISQGINGFNIELMPDTIETELKYKIQLDRFERSLRDQLSPLEYSEIKEIRAIGDQGKAFIYTLHSPTDALRHLEIYMKFGNRVYQFTAEVLTESVDEEIINMLKITQSMRLRQSDEIPVEPGLCIEGGFVKSNGFEVENVGIDFSLPEYPGFNMVFFAGMGIEPSDDQKLNARVSNSWAFSGFTDMVKVQRKSNITLLGQQGNELVYSGGEKGIHFLTGLCDIWGSGTISKQRFGFRMNNDSHDEDENRYPKTLPDETAIEIWDAMLMSVERRPGAY